MHFAGPRKSYAVEFGTCCVEFDPKDRHKILMLSRLKKETIDFSKWWVWHQIYLMPCPPCKTLPGEDTATIDRLTSDEGLKCGCKLASKSRINAFR